MITKHNFDVLLGIRLVKKIKTAGNGLKLWEFCKIDKFLSQEILS
jgi:hypothetical protein